MNKFKVKLKIRYDKSKPDGMPKKCLDTTRAKNMDGNPKIILIKHLKLLTNIF